MNVSLWQTGGGFYQTFRGWVSAQFERRGWRVVPLPAQGRVTDVGDLMFSMNFSPELARLARNLRKPYVCWVWDALVNYNLLNPENASDYTILFQFAPSDQERFQRAGYRHVYHLPSSTDHQALLRQAAAVTGPPCHAIVFAGHCYGAEQSPYAGYRESALRLGTAGKAAVAVMDRFLGETTRHPACRLREAFAGLARTVMPEFFDVAPVPQAAWRAPLDHALDFFVNTLLYHESDIRIRSSLIRRLAPLGVDIWGEAKGWQPHVGPGIALHPPCSLETDMGAVLTSGQIALNLSRNISDGANMRTFEIPAVGAFQLALYSDEMARLFEPSREIVLFQTLDEAHDLAHYYLNHEAERQQIARAGHHRFLHEHTLDHRFDALLKTLKTIGISS